MVGYGLLALRHSVPEGVSIVMGNGMLSVSISTYCHGLYRFNDRTPHWPMLAFPVVLMLGVNLVFIHNLQARFLIHSWIYSGQLAFLLVLLQGCYSPAIRRGALLLGLGEAVVIAILIGRFVVVSTGWVTIATYNQSNTLQTLTYVSAIATTLTLSMGILMMAQQRAENRLAFSERQYRQVVEAATEGICILQGGHVRYANPHMHRALGYEAETLAGTLLRDLVFDDDWPLVQHNHQRRLDGQGEHLTYAARLNTRHNGVRWFEISGVRIEWQGLTATLNFFNDITQRHDQEEAIKDQATHDALTGLPNRRLLLDRLAKLQASTVRYQNWAALVFFDLDRFKELNDTHGHHAGDRLLQEVAHRLSGGVRGMDTVARLGGDEFVVLLCDLDGPREPARLAAEGVTGKLLASLAQPYHLALEAPDAVESVHHRCSASAGWVLFSGQIPDADTLLKQADAAMYAAKKAGRNRVVMHAPDTAETSSPT